MLIRVCKLSEIFSLILEGIWRFFLVKQCYKNKRTDSFKATCAYICVLQIEVMHEESQGGSTHVVVTNETEESLSNRRR